VGFGLTQLGRQGAVGVGVEHGVDLRAGEAGSGKEAGPAVVLGGLGDRLVFGGELQDAAPTVLLGGDRLVRGQLGADMLEHAVEDSASGDVGIVVRAGVGVLVIVPINGDVGVVAVRATG